MIDLLVGVGIILGTCIGIFAFFWGVYYLIVDFMCTREFRRYESFLKPVTKEAGKKLDREKVKK